MAYYMPLQSWLPLSHNCKYQCRKTLQLLMDYITFEAKRAYVCDNHCSSKLVN